MRGSLSSDAAMGTACATWTNHNDNPCSFLAFSCEILKGIHVWRAVEPINRYSLQEQMDIPSSNGHLSLDTPLNLVHPKQIISRDTLTRYISCPPPLCESLVHYNTLGPWRILRTIVSTNETFLCNPEIIVADSQDVDPKVPISEWRIHLSACPQVSLQVADVLS